MVFIGAWGESIPGPSRLVAQRLNHYATPGPDKYHICWKYSKLPPDDEQLIFSKRVVYGYWNKWREKEVHLVGSYYANITWCMVHRISNSSACAWPHILTWSSERKQFVVATPTPSLRLYHAPPSLGGELKRPYYFSFKTDSHYERCRTKLPNTISEYQFIP
jgi:hypothetical protein